MAERDPTDQHESRRLSRADIEVLADHAIGRAISRFTDDQPQERQRMLIIAACLRVLARDNPAGVEIDVYTGR